MSHVRKAKACGSLLSTKYAFFSGYFSTNMVRVLPFTPLKVFSFQSWKSMMCVHMLSKKAVKCEVQIMLPVKDEPVLKPPDVIL